MVSKDTIIKNFSRAAATYDDFSDLQREAAKVVARLASEVFSGGRGPLCVLDAGCGTGALLEGLLDYVRGGSLVGSDIALPMARKARRVTDKVAAADCEALPFRDSSFDMVVSSLAFQWTDVAASVREAARVLKGGGALAFSTLGPGTLTELKECREDAEKEIFGRARSVASPFRDPSSIKGNIAAAGLTVSHIDTQSMPRVYKDAFDLVRTLKMVGASEIGLGRIDSLANAAVLRRAANIYGERYGAKEADGNGGVVATYEVIFAVARKG